MDTEKTVVKSGRIAAIDILRCLAIIGMTFSANEGFFSDLPGWMFHAQTPPPTYDFNPNNPGLTWVDLVFPFFLLSMGAALPFSLRKKLSKGESKAAVCGGLVKRWLTLTAFALVLGNAYRVGSGVQPQWAQSLLRMFVWAALCLALMRANSEKRWVHIAINVSGVILIVVCAVLLKFVFGVPLTTDNDIIIMILAVASLLGGLLWLLTKDSIALRWLCLALVVALKAVSSYAPQALSFIPAVPPVAGWAFQWSFLQYLIPVLAGSIVGDIILGYVRTPERNGALEENMWLPASLIAVSAVIVQLWGLYTRNILADLLLSVTLAGIFLAVTRKVTKSVWARIGYIGFIFLVSGVLFDPLDGGITKDYCNLSYLFTTSGMGILVVSALLCCELNAGLRCRFLSSVGQNPMVAYTVTGFIVGPVLTLTGAMSLLENLSLGSPFWGVAKGAVLTLLMMLCTWLCTKVKIFWRS